MTPTSPQSPALLPPPAASWRRWLILWLCLALVEAILLINNAHLDTLFWNATRWFVGDHEYYNWTQFRATHLPIPSAPFYVTDDPPFESHFYKHTQHLWEVFRTFGEPAMTAVLLLLLAIYSRRKWLDAASALLATSLAGGLGALIRITAGRFRPTHIDGANQWLLFRGFHDGSDLSFPSGHATLAFATAAVLAYLSPRGRWIFIPLAAGCAISRVVMGAHFWSDAIFGACLGWTLGWWLTFLLDKFLSRKIGAS